MFTFIVRRLLALIPVFFGGTILLFGLMQLAPGDMISTMRQDPRVKPETIERLEKKFLLNEPIPVQYGAWIFNLVQGDLGNSFIYGDQPVTAVIGRPIVNSLWIVIPELILGYLISIPLGVFTALRQNKFPDIAIGVTSFFLAAFPSFFLGLIIVFLLLNFKFATGFALLPIGGMTSDTHDFMNPLEQFLDIARHAIAPIFTLLLLDASISSRFFRAQILDALGQDYIRTAKSKGLSENVVMYKHVLRNASVPFIASIGGTLPGLIGGAGLIEYIFNWPGITPTILAALSAKDVFMYVGFVAMTLVLLAIGNLIADLLLAVVDPRIRYG
jgi:peptide/nickel transport system permease protein